MSAEEKEVQVKWAETKDQSNRPIVPRASRKGAGKDVRRELG